MRSLRTFAAACIVFAAGAAGAAGRSQDFGQDFDTLWRAIDARYAYLESRDAWKRARSAWRKKATSAGSREQFVTAVEGALRSLHDDHVTLSEATPRSPRRVPRDTDVWASWREGRATIEAVRYAGDADYAGVHPGDVVTRVDGRPVEQATSGLAGRDASPPVRDWALRHVLAGPREGTVVLDLAGAEPRRVEVERNGRHPANAPAANGRRIGEARDIGYLRLRNLADPQLGAQLDGALAELRDTRALIIDLREATPGPRATTLAMLARFAVREAPWQIREGRDGKRDADRIRPASQIAHQGPLVVLADRWTAGEVEALVAGLVAVAHAKYVGTPMAGLHGELHSVRLPHTGIVVHFPGEKTFLPDGTPRESLRPGIAVDLIAPNGGPGDPILYQALKALEKS